MTKKKTKGVKKEKKQIVEIHIYVHQSNPNGVGGGNSTQFNQCTCDIYKGSGTASSSCPVHPNGKYPPPNVTIG